MALVQCFTHKLVSMYLRALLEGPESLPQMSYKQKFCTSVLILPSVNSDSHASPYILPL